MPIMNGLEALKEIMARQSSTGRHAVKYNENRGGKYDACDGIWSS